MMKSLRLCTDSEGNSKFESLPLPFLGHERSDFVGVVAQPGQQGLDGSSFPHPELVKEAKTLRTARYEEGDVETGPGQTRHLAFVVSGTVEVTAAYEMKAILHAGDVLFVDDVASSGHTMAYHGDSRLIQVEMADSWVPTGEVPPAIEDFPHEPQDGSGLNVMYSADDNQSYFRKFDELFPETRGATAPRPIVGILFRCSPPHIPESSFWHCHPNNSLIIKLAGDSELEVGGGGGAFVRSLPGSVTLCLEHTGAGHVTHLRRQSRSAEFVLHDDYLWGVPK